ncbi:hypothetical protein P5665_00050 (plasmid) [Bacillus subtilis]|nr:hypothetical protein P5665_00100 [Bacillus subtilis]WGD89607.1 hypothetical protein P5665_00050 [Bacillus subtilis]
MNFTVKLLMSFVFGALGALLMVSVREHFSFTVTLIVLVVVIIVAFILDELWKRHKKREKKINLLLSFFYAFFLYGVPSGKCGFTTLNYFWETKTCFSNSKQKKQGEVIFSLARITRWIHHKKHSKNWYRYESICTERKVKDL